MAPSQPQLQEEGLPTGKTEREWYKKEENRQKSGWVGERKKENLKKTWMPKSTFKCTNWNNDLGKTKVSLLNRKELGKNDLAGRAFIFCPICWCLKRDSFPIFFREFECQFHQRFGTTFTLVYPKSVKKYS